jgi:hypothetical protein
MFKYSILPVESKMKKTPWPTVTVTDVMCAAVLVYKDQGFVRSGQGYTDTSPESGEPVEIRDNKSCIIDILEDPNMSFTDEETKNANDLIDTINGKLMIKKMTNNLNNFEQNVAKALSDPQINNFAVSIIASLPHSVEIDKKREAVEDKMSALKHSSMYFGTRGKRYDINVKVLDVKFIQTSDVYMITTVYADKDIIKFWWRDQPDISDIISDKIIKIRGTVNKHELSKYSNAKETVVNRVKILQL